MPLPLKCPDYLQILQILRSFDIPLFAVFYRIWPHRSENRFNPHAPTDSDALQTMRD